MPGHGLTRRELMPTRTATWACHPAWKFQTPTIFLVALTLLLAATAAYAQVDVTAALDVTDGYARPGAYVPVHFSATNHTGETIAGVRLDTTSPIDVEAPWQIAPGGSSDKIIPVFYVGGDLRIAIEFTSAQGRTIARTVVAPPTFVTLPAGKALVAFENDLPNLDEALKKQLAAKLGAEALRFLRLPPDTLRLAERCSVLGATVGKSPLYTQAAMEGAGAIVTLSEDGKAALMAPPVPPGATELVQPEAFRLLAARPWPAEDRQRLWLWLGLFALAVLAVGVLVPRRRALVAAGTMIAVAAAATAFIYFMGDVRTAHVRLGEVRYVAVSDGSEALEELVFLESRGGATAKFVQRAAGLDGDGRAHPLPLPILESSDDLFRRQATLHYSGGEEDSIESLAPRFLIHRVQWVKLGNAALQNEPPKWPQLGELAKEPDFLAALRVDGNKAADNAGRVQTIDAWSVEWKSDADPEIAYVGRSLAWWNRQRRTGDKPVVLLWRREPPRQPGESEIITHLPTLVVYSSE